MRKFKLLLTTFILILFGIACNKEELGVEETDNWIITMEEAIEIVQKKTTFRPKEEKIDIRRKSFRTIDKHTLKDKNGISAIHIINYTKNTERFFSLISGDKRLPVVLAYGNGRFDYKKIIEGIKVWVDGQIDIIEYVRDCKYTRHQFFEEVIQARVEPEGSCEGQSYIHTVGPLLSTSWGQGCFYNDNLPTGCTGDCGHESAGCAATAMSQIMNYHEHPNTYNWSLMQNIYTTAATAQQVEEVATLMFDTGDAVDMDWVCDASGIPFDGFGSNLSSAFSDDFDFSNGGNYQALQYPQPIKANINNNKPVIFVGLGDGGGHAWVGDGYREHHICEVDEYTGEVYGWTYSFFSMNWGWDGFQNGWFGYSSWGGNFNEDQHVLLNITP